LRDARLQIGKPLVLRAGPQHFERYDGVGLRAAVARVPADLQAGDSADVGRAELRAIFDGPRCLVRFDPKGRGSDLVSRAA
jgi:hypothetical protein